MYTAVVAATSLHPTPGGFGSTHQLHAELGCSIQLLENLFRRCRISSYFFGVAVVGVPVAGIEGVDGGSV